jgi:hypothetical protein
MTEEEMLRAKLAMAVQREELVKEKLDVQQRLGTIKESIANAKRIRGSRGEFSDPVWYANQHRERKHLALLYAGIDKKLNDLSSRLRTLNLECQIAKFEAKKSIIPMPEKKEKWASIDDLRDAI